MILLNSRENGQATPLVLALLALAVVFALVVAKVGSSASLRSQAQNAADSAALAGANDGQGAALEYAKRNKAKLTLYSDDGQTVVVAVEVEGVRATSTARRTQVTALDKALRGSTIPVR